MRVAITGATGLLGRNLLFEIIKSNLQQLDQIEIIVLGRSGKAKSFKERLREIIIYDGFDYLNINNKEAPATIKAIERCVTPIDFDLIQDDLAISKNDYDKLKVKPIDHFFHLAALSDFRAERTVMNKLSDINIQGTKRILHLITTLDVKEIIYTGSAYSCGEKKGQIKADYVNKKEKYRNFYEESKLLGEILCREYANSNKIKLRVFRPVGICGRLLEKPIGGICKYDIFYGWASFFLRQKIKTIKKGQDPFLSPKEILIRICCDLQEGIDLVPADYAAKLICAVCFGGYPGESFHLVSDERILHKTYLPLILNELGVVGCQLVGSEPKEKNEIEQIYYKTVGKIYTPYLLYKHGRFDQSNLEYVKEKEGILAPKMDINNFLALLKYAKDHYFGLKLKTGGYQ